MAYDKKQIERTLKEKAKLGRDAAVRALNDTAFNTRKHLQEQLPTIFDRPTPFIKNSIRYTKADPTDQIPRSKVSIFNEPVGKGNNPTNVLTPEIEGGFRKYKRFERALRYKGILPAKMYVVPGEDAKLDQSGNISGSWIVRILSTLQAFNETGYMANETTRSRLAKKNPLDLFIMPKDNSAGWAPGVYQRSGNKIKQLLKFVRTPRYKKHFKFYEIAGHYYDQNYRKQLNYQLSKLESSLGPPRD